MSTIQVGQANQPGQTSTLNALVPPEGPKVVAVPVDFSIYAQAEVDFTLAMAGAKITAVQSLILDNSKNAQPVTIQVSGTGQTITAPARSQGVYAIVSTNRPKFDLSTAGGVALLFLFLNVPLPTAVWYAGGSYQSGGQPLGTDITHGGTAVAVFDPPPAGGGAVVNPFNAAESLFVDIVNAAGTSAPGANGTTVELVAGQSFAIPPNFGGVVSANAVTNGHTFSAYGWG